MTQENEALIEKFLTGNITEEEKKNFNIYIKNPEFALEVSFYKQLKTAAILEGKKELKKKLEQISVDYQEKQKNKPILLFPKWARYGVAAGVAFIFISVYFFTINRSYRNKSNTYVQNLSLDTQGPKRDTHILRSVATLDTEKLLEQRIALTREAGINALKKYYYATAIDSFEKIDQCTPSPENCNNLGTARTLYALSLIPAIDVYPIELKYKSHVTIDLFSIEQNNNDLLQRKKNMLISAQGDFEKAINLNAQYYEAYVNLACIYDLLGVPQASIDKIKELPVEVQNQKNAYLILSIAYHHLQKEAESKRMFDKARNAKR